MGVDGLASLCGKIAESMWRAEGWVCDGISNAVVDTLKQVSDGEVEMVAVHASIGNERGPVQPDMVETQEGRAQSRMRLG